MAKGRPRISGLYIYPIKSCGGITVASAAVTATGLQWDRQWMVVGAPTSTSSASASASSPPLRFITQRQCARMALIRTSLPPEALLPPHTWAHTLPPDACLSITAPGHPPLHVPLALSWYHDQARRGEGTRAEGRAGGGAEGERGGGGGGGGGEGGSGGNGEGGGRWVAVTVWGWTGRALDAGEDAAHWFSSVIGRPVRLVRFDTAHVVRPTNAAFAEGFQTSFADGYPMLLLSQPSLSLLNARLSDPIPMNRFRPNIVVEGCEPFDEDTWRSFSIARSSNTAAGEEADESLGSGSGSGCESSGAASAGVFRGVKPCSRCKITTIDQLTAESGKEPLQTLLKFRRGKDLGLPTSLQDRRLVGSKGVAETSMASKAVSSTLSRESADSFWDDDDDVPAHRTGAYDVESAHLARSAGPDGRSGLADSRDGELDSLMPAAGSRSAHLGAARAENGLRADDYLHGAGARLGPGGREAEKRLREHEMERAYRGWPSCWQIWGEILDQMELGAPLSAANLLSFARFLFSLAFLGRRSTLQLAAAAVAITFTNVTGFSLLIGLASGIEPLCAQAHGAQQPRAMGLLLRRSTLLLTLASIPIAIIWSNSQRLLLAAGQDAPLVSEATTFILWLLPDLFLSALVNPLRIFLRAQGIVRPVLVGAALSLAVHVLATALLVAGPVRLGCAGAAAAASISDLFLWLLMLFYLHCFTDVPRRCGLLVPLSFSASPLTSAAAAAESGVSSPRSPHSPRSPRPLTSPTSPASPLSPTRHLSARPSSLAQWGPLIRMSLPACATICLEWWCYELCMLLSGLLPDATTSVAALAILFNLDSILYSLTAGLAAAAGTRAGNLLGSAFPILARNAALVALGCSLMLGITQLAVLWAAREALGHVFTSDAAVLEAVTALLPILGLLERT
ncbi:unnamed protein product [Closterium sp. Naga37s-1]|nr:unnamed protein product [Closterium sp. Naga37s-1]